MQPWHCLKLTAKPCSLPASPSGFVSAANATIFAQLEKEALKAGFGISVPPGHLCTDNAAMIAWAALERREAPDKLDFAPLPRWPLDPNAAPPPGQGVRS